MSTPTKARPQSKARLLKKLDALMPLHPEYRTRRVAWALRLLLKQPTLRERRGVLHDNDVLQELGLAHDLDSHPPAILRAWLERRLAQIQSGPLGDDSISQNARWFGEQLGLTPAELKLLDLAATLEASQALRGCMEPFKHHSSACLVQLLAELLDESASDIRGSLSHRSTLFRAKIIRFRPGNNFKYSHTIELESPFDEIMSMHYEQPHELFETISPRASAAERPLNAFSHLAREVDVLVALIRGAHQDGASGINVLFHGPPGSGKSQLARSIAQALDVPLHEVPATRVQGEELDGTARLNLLNAIQRLHAGAGPSLVLFDEIEDAFPWEISQGWLRRSSGKDKARTNRLLEDNAVPCIWIGNDVEQLDPAFLRRFSLVVEVSTPPRAIREAMLAHYSAELDVPVDVRSRLAEHTWVVPADAARAAQVTRLVQRGLAPAAGASEPSVTQSAHPPHLADASVFERALGGSRRLPTSRSAHLELDYDLGLVNASISLEQLSSGLKERGEGSICLYGPPGTGKTAFARQLAKLLDRPFLHKSAGDLLDMFVGGTEKAIAAMFEEAAQSESVLLLDEAEGLFQHRAAAVRSYEVTQVNELLVRMEAFRGIFLCATNTFQALDPAALRRFALRVEFSPLNVEQHLQLFERIAEKLGLSIQDAGNSVRGRLSRLTALTPGDYASLLRGRLLLGRANVDVLLDDLERAHGEKRAERQIGFR